MNNLNSFFIRILCLVGCILIANTLVQNCSAGNPPSTAGSESEKCFNSAKSQYDLDLCAGKDLTSSKASAVALYRRLLSIYTNNPSFVEKLKRSQSTWLLFTQAQLAMKFPHSGEEGYYGSMYPMCVGEYLAYLYSQRIQSLTPPAISLQIELQHGSGSNQISTKLKNMYRAISDKYSDDKLFISYFQSADMAWEQYENAQLAAMFPHGPNKLFDGTSMSADDYLDALQMQRIAELKDWTSGIEEGDVCSGSVKTPEELSDSN